MPDLLLVRVGELPRGLLSRLSDFLADSMNLGCRESAATIDPAPAYDESRGQYNCRLLLPGLEAVASAEGEKVLGLSDFDLFSPAFTFVFGESRLGGDAGLVSVHRLRPSLYGLPDDPQLFMSRARREALHESGHLFGLPHCRHPDCVMRFSGAVEEVDLKSDALCPSCRSALGISAVSRGI